MFELPAERTTDRRTSETSERRRLVGQKVRAARETLTSSSGPRPEFGFELARIYAQNRISAVPVALTVAAVIAGVSMTWLVPPIALAWLVFALAGQVLVAALARRFVASEVEATHLKLWITRFAGAEALNGIAWASIVILLAGAGDTGDAAEIVSLFVMLVGVAVATMLASTVPIAACAATLPIAAIVIGTYVLKGGAAATAVAALSAGAEIYFLLLAQRLHATALETLEFRAEKDALIGELEQAKSNSDEARRRAEEANLAKSRFLATMSHELRTPLNAILGFSEVMKTEVFGPHATPTYKEYADDIHQSGQHLLNLINEILDLSRIEAGRYELNEESVRLAYIVEDCHHLLKLRAKKRGIQIREIAEPDLPPVWADERAMRQVVLNLLSNAIKFTPQGGEIRLKLGWTTSGGQYVSVSDTGPGIPEDEIPTVLASFGQGSLAIKTAEQGAGLGLPIVKGLIDLHGGGFSLKSRLREGTEVIVTLPASRVMSALAPVPDKGQPARDRAEAPAAALLRRAG
ncbi:sensor histidine kinase [Chenggangzhangella methanolivorans]|uniref:histidine kinase n=1 Tax=Chenggangzhangella methanolivorans TaxID=1437009 RepID=A0A9E6REC4_9HYPH|nr:ATP-binding protein [Chenggangzhangella methanolivorans]QZO02490.1 sensor histidine kinase [Chenggangzhangella methanolivorans]